VKVGDGAILTIEKIVAKGEALARDGEHIWFIPGALAGEKVSVRLLSKKNNICRGELLEIIESSTFRRTPFCPYYGICGGCDMQHIDHDQQVKIKENIVLENLQRIAHIETASDTRDFTYLGAYVDTNIRYRKKVRFQVDLKNHHVGFLAKKSHTVVDLTSCPIISEPLQQLLQQKRDLLFEQAAKSSGRFTQDIVTIAAIEGDAEKVSISQQVIPVTCDSHQFYVNARVFFQSHQGVLAHMISKVSQWAEGSTIIDLYSGIGTFASAVENDERRVYAIEKERQCLSLAKKHLRHTTFFSEYAQHWIKRFPDKEVGTVIVDPPRAGLTQQVIDSISTIAPRRLIYISCDSATFSRDTLRFLEKGYQLNSLEYLEMYPHTSHTETMALFVPCEKKK